MGKTTSLHRRQKKKKTTTHNILESPTGPKHHLVLRRDAPCLSAVCFRFVRLRHGINFCLLGCVEEQCVGGSFPDTSPDFIFPKKLSESSTELFLAGGAGGAGTPSRLNPPPKCGERGKRKKRETREEELLVVAEKVVERVVHIIHQKTMEELARALRSFHEKHEKIKHTVHTVSRIVSSSFVVRGGVVVSSFFRKSHAHLRRLTSPRHR
jgi:hypothetical protein